jgi:hypothetical protein
MFKNVIALCLLSSDDVCIFNNCPLFEKCYPDKYAEWKEKCNT